MASINIDLYNQLDRLPKELLIKLLMENLPITIEDRMSLTVKCEGILMKNDQTTTKFTAYCCQICSSVGMNPFQVSCLRHCISCYLRTCENELHCYDMYTFYCLECLNKHGKQLCPHSGCRNVARIWCHICGTTYCGSCPCNRR